MIRPLKRTISKFSTAALLLLTLASFATFASHEICESFNEEIVEFVEIEAIQNRVSERQKSEPTGQVEYYCKNCDQVKALIVSTSLLYGNEERHNLNGVGAYLRT